ncbi:MAG: FMN-binding protein [Methylococcales bacterium]|jgi:Na+-translocating ferredoxin:NAD+ oxidoreductase RnfG subunit
MQITKLLLFLWLFAITSASFATIYYSKNEAMELAFGKGTEIESLSLFPDEEQITKIEQVAKIKLDSGLFTFYVGRSQNKILAYAAIETTNVRTKPETLMIVLTPDGALRDVHVLAFHEPAEYEPPNGWFKKLYNRPLAELEINKGVDGISGATLSTRSAINSIRKVMTIYQVMIKNKDPE